MVAFSRIIAASSIIALSFAAPIRSLVERKAFGGYKVYGGKGTVADGWPSKDSWWTIDELFAANDHILKASCKQYPGSPADNSKEEIDAIKQAIKDVSKESGVPAEYIFASMMQESKGCVRAPTTNYGVRNPGLMQSFNGKSTCNEGGVTNPCPQSTIKQMVTEGVGIGLEFGIKQAIAQSGSNDVDSYYKAARIYNSGHVDASGNLGAGIATHCYSSDIANRLTGWVDQQSSCQEGTIGSQTGSSGGSTGNTQPQTPPTTTPPTSSPPTTTPPKNENNGSGENSPSAPKAEGAAANCKSWYTVQAGDNCSSAGISFEQLKSLNSGIDANCSNLWSGYAYCIAA